MKKHIVLRGSYVVEFFDFEKGFYIPFFRYSCNRDFFLDDLISFTRCRVELASSRSKESIEGSVWFRVRLSEDFFHHFRIEFKSSSRRVAAL